MLAGLQAAYRGPAGRVCWGLAPVIRLNLPVFTSSGEFFLTFLSVDLVEYMSVVSFQIWSRLAGTGGRLFRWEVLYQMQDCMFYGCMMSENIFSCVSG